ncbi:MAG TPA: hypothetical protein VGK86_15850 [Thermoanaerobaculia bacterium]
MESPSLEWIHRVREAHYEKTKALPLDSWLKPVDPQRVLAACEELGLKVRLADATADRTVRRKES